MLRSRFYSALAIALSPLALSTIACFHTTTDSQQAAPRPSPDTLTVTRAFRSVTVERTQDSVTIVVIAKRGMGIDVVPATYRSGPTYQLWIKKGEVTVTHIPWHSGGLRFSRSLPPISAEPGDVWVLLYPDDL